MATDSTLTTQATHYLRFPPFPPAPDGVKIIPFHSFKPSGILVPIDEDDDIDARELGDGVERDGLGIPTIVLRVKHAMDSLEKKKKRKKKGVGAQQVQVAPERPKMWWEVWEETEDIRRNTYDASVPRLLSIAVPCALNVWWDVGICLLPIASIRRALTLKMVVVGQRPLRAYNTCGILCA